MKNSFIVLSLLFCLIFAIGCSDSEGGNSKPGSELSITISNPDSLRNLSLIYKIGNQQADTILDIAEGVVPVEVPAFSDSISIQYSIVSMGYVLVSKDVTLYSDQTMEEKSITVQTALIAAIKDIQKDSKVDTIPLSTLYKALFKTLGDSGSLAIGVRYADSTQNKTLSLLDTDVAFFNEDTVKVVLTFLIEKNQIDTTTVALLPEKWVPKEEAKISNELLFSITSESMLSQLPGVYSVSQVDSMKMARLEDSVFTEKMVEVSPGLLAARWEVTQKQYDDLMEYTVPNEEDEEKPKVGVSIYDAILFCNALSNKEGLDSVYTYTDVTIMGTHVKEFTDLVVLENADGYRLPTTTEWSIAYTSGALGNDIYYWGDSTDSAVIDRYANVSFSDTVVLEPVGKRRPNPAGLFDMNGNAAELTINIDEDRFYYFLGGSYLSENLNDFEAQIIDGSRRESWIGFRLFRYKL